MRKQNIFFLPVIFFSMQLFYQSCSNSGETVNCQDSDLAIQSATTTEASCNQPDGTVIVEVAGGSTPYQYRIGGITTEDKNISGLGAGQYTLIVTDALGCEVSQSVQINTTDSDLNFEFSIVQTDCGNSDGEISIEATGGSGEYEYSLDNGAFQTENNFSNLQAGEYEVKVRDSDGCTFSGSARVTTTVTLSGNIMPIIEANCAISGCHNGSQSPNLSTPNSVISNANSIRSQTQSGAMPKDATLDQASIDAIACWVDDGAPDN